MFNPGNIELLNWGNTLPFTYGRRRWRRILPLLYAGMLLTSFARASVNTGSTRGAQSTVDDVGSLPEHLNGVGIDEHLGKLLPLGLRFVDESGREVTLASYFNNTVPVILTLNYSNCPMLCSLELTGLANGLSKLDLSLGQSYRIITVSLDPHESPDTARRTQARYTKQFGSNGRASWHFLTGTEQAIRSLADAVGFRYRYDSRQNQYYHAAAIAIASPQGQLMRYLYGIEYSRANLKLGLMEAAQGRIGATIDRLLLFCSAYSPSEQGYRLVASRIIMVAGSFVLFVLLAVLVVLWRREAKRAQKRTSSGALARRANIETDALLKS